MLIVTSSTGLVILISPLASAIPNSAQQDSTILSPPSGLVAKAIIQTAFTASWNLVPNATSYDVKVTNVLNPSYIIAQDNITRTSARINGLTPGNQYYWDVIAKNSLGVSSPSSLVYTWTVSPPPTGITVLVTSPTTANVSWIAAPGATEYQLIFTPQGQTGTIVDVTAMSYSLVNLIPNQNYSITLSSGNPSGYSEQSDPVTFSTSPTLAYHGTIGTITFAMGHAYTDQMPAMNNLTKDNFAGNISPVGIRIGTPQYMTSSQILAYSHSGWEILSHSMTHPAINDTTPDSVLQYEIVHSKTNLTNMGFCISGYESPFDIITNSSAKYIHANYKYAVVNPDVQNTVYSITHIGAQYNFSVAIHYYGVGKGFGLVNTFATAKSLIDFAIKNHTYLILNFHQIDATSPDPYSTYPSMFWQILQYVKQQSDAGQLKVENSAQALGISCP